MLLLLRDSGTFAFVWRGESSNTRDFFMNCRKLGSETGDLFVAKCWFFMISHQKHFATSTRSIINLRNDCETTRLKTNSVPVSTKRQKNERFYDWKFRVLLWDSRWIETAQKCANASLNFTICHCVLWWMAFACWITRNRTFIIIVWGFVFDSSNGIIFVAICTSLAPQTNLLQVLLKRFAICLS